MHVDQKIILQVKGISKARESFSFSLSKIVSTEIVVDVFEFAKIISLLFFFATFLKF